MSIAAALAESGTKSASFPTPGTKVSGKVISSKYVQSTEFQTNAPEWWDDAKTRPKMNVVITVDTGVIDPTVEGDQGHRGIYIKWWGGQQKAMDQALAAAGPAAIRDGQKDVLPGDWFSAEYVGDWKDPSKPHLPAAKEYRYQVIPAGATASAFNTAVTAPASTAPLTQQAPPAAAPAPAPAPAPVAAPPAAPAAPAAPQIDTAALTATVKQWIGAGWSAAQVADRALSGPAGFPAEFLNYLDTLKAGGADPAAVITQLAG